MKKGLNFSGHNLISVFFVILFGGVSLVLFYLFLCFINDNQNLQLLLINPLKGLLAGYAVFLGCVCVMMAFLISSHSFEASGGSK